MDDMKEFLTSCGLGNAIPVFERHELSVDQLEELSKNDMKELLPALGPRLKLVKAIKQRTLQNERLMKSRPKSKMKMSERKKMKKNDPEKNAFVLRMLKDKRHLADLYQAAVEVLVKLSLFTFDDGCRPTSPDWTLIDFDHGKLNCLLCETQIRIQTRSGKGLLWHVGNFMRHFKIEHKIDKTNGVGEETSKNDSFLEVVSTDEQDEELLSSDGPHSSNDEEESTTGNSTQASVSIRDATKRKRVSNISNENTSKRATFDISHEQLSVSDHVKKASSLNVGWHSLMVEMVSNETSESFITKNVVRRGVISAESESVVTAKEVEASIEIGFNRSDKITNKTTVPIDPSEAHACDNAVDFLIDSGNCTVNLLLSASEMVTQDKEIDENQREILQLLNKEFYCKQQTNQKNSETDGTQCNTSAPRKLKLNIPDQSDDIPSEPLIDHSSPDDQANQTNGGLRNDETKTIDTSLDIPKIEMLKPKNKKPKSEETKIPQLPISQMLPVADKTANPNPLTQFSVKTNEPSEITNGKSANINASDDVSLTVWTTENYSTILAVDNMERQSNSDQIFPEISLDNGNKTINTLIDWTVTKLSSTALREKTSDIDVSEVVSEDENLVVEADATTRNECKIDQIDQCLDEYEKEGQDKEETLGLAPLIILTVEDVPTNGHLVVETKTVTSDANADQTDATNSNECEGDQIDEFSDEDEKDGQSEDETLGLVPDWQVPGVKFGWAKKNSQSTTFLPGFMLSNETFRWITSKAAISTYTFPPSEFMENLPRPHKKSTQIKSLRTFNKNNKTSFE